ncbi:MAG: ankyrin repeat domain-containing protein [Gammaproteobacteria bacterium]
MLHGPRGYSFYSDAFKMIIKLLAYDPNCVEFSFDNLNDKKNIFINFKDNENKNISCNFTNILEKADLEHFLLDDATLIQIENHLGTILPYFTSFREMPLRSNDDKLKSPEALSIYNYTLSSTEMNGILRKDYNKVCSSKDTKQIDDFLKKEVLELALLSSALNKLPTVMDEKENKTQKSYRGEKSPTAVFEKRKAEVEKGEISKEYSFVSTSDDMDSALRFASNVQTLAPHGQMPVFLVFDSIYGKKISQYSAFSSSEKEFLILPCEVSWRDFTSGNEYTPAQFSGQLIRPLHLNKEKEELEYKNSSEYREISRITQSKLAQDNNLSQLNNSLQRAIIEKNYETFYKIIGLVTYHELSEAFLLATECGEFEMVKELIAKGVNINAVNKNNENALIAAAKNGRSDISNLLLQNNININYLDKNNMSALMWAAKNNQEQILKILLSVDNCEVNNEDEENHYTALRFAVEAQNASAVSLLLEKGANTYIADTNGIIPYMASANKKNEQIKEILLQKLDIAKMYAGQTLLMRAAQKNTPEMLRMLNILIEKGAKVDIEDNDGITALHIAVRNKNLPAVKVLVANGADVNQLAKDGSSALSMAIYMNDLEITKYLMERGADIEIKNNTGRSVVETLLLLAEINNTEVPSEMLELLDRLSKTSPLTRALKNGNNQTILNLISSGHKADLSFNKEFSPLEMAIYLKHPLAEDIFHSVAIEPNSDYAKKIMILALHTGNESIVRNLVDSGFNLDKRWESGHTLYEWATSKKMFDIANLIKKIKGATNTGRVERHSPTPITFSNLKSSSDTGSENKAHSANKAYKPPKKR